MIQAIAAGLRDRSCGGTGAPMASLRVCDERQTEDTPMRHLIAFAVATSLFAAPAALAQSAMPNSSADQGMSMQGQTPKSASGDAMAKPAKKAHHRMARNEASQ